MADESALTIDQYKTYYAVIDRGDGQRCAWCERLLSEFKYPNDHLTIEDVLSKVEIQYSESEELLYGDFIKLKERILKGGEENDSSR